MQVIPQSRKRPKQPKQVRASRQAWNHLLLFMLILIILIGGTFLPNTAHASGQVTLTPQVITTILTPHGQQRDIQRGISRQTTASNDGCQDIIFYEWVNWGIRIYFNECALTHLTALTVSGDAATGILSFISLWCPECVPVVLGLSAVAGAVSANIAFLQYMVKQCGGTGAYLEISLNGGWRFRCANDLGS